MKTVVINRVRPFLVATTLAVLATGSINAALAADLELLGYRWDKPTVAFWINAGNGVSASAANDIRTAFSDWDAVLKEIPGAPRLTPATSRKRADIVLDMRPRSKGWRFGDFLPLAESTDTKLSDCTINGQQASLLGSWLADEVPGGDPRIRNLARRFVGNLLGLGNIHCSDPEPVGACADDVMDGRLSWQFPAVDFAFSVCDLLGIATIYDPSTDCGQIPASIPFDCQ